MNQHATTLKTAIVVGLLCLFALGRVAYAAQQCYRLAGGGCGGGIERSIGAKQDESHEQVTVCAQAMEAPDDRGSSTVLTHAAFAVAPPLTLAFVPAPAFQTPPVADLEPPPTHVTLLTSFGRLRL